MKNLNHLWTTLIVEELVRCGVEMFCVAPGSRSTLLVAAVAAHPKAQAVVHYDERGTAFFALGYGRATRRPAVWITTSGTALANGFPAIIEAATDGVPMLLLTADRPPELRQTGANQTIDQVKLFGDYVRWFFDLPTPTTAIDPAMVLTTVDQAVHRAVRTPSGPVHLNCMFREPLAPTPDGQDYTSYLDGRLASWRSSEAPYTCYAEGNRQMPDNEVATLAEAVRGVERGLIVAGRLHTAEEGQAVVRLAEQLGWPLLPDVGSQVRLGHGDHGSVIGYYDQLLASESFANAHQPEAVVRLGGRSTSKRLAQWLARYSPHPHVVIDDRPDRLDPHHHVTHRIEADLPAFCHALTNALPPRPPTAWLKSWQHASTEANTQINYFFAAQKNIGEPLVARHITQHIEEGHGLVLASSMPVRDVDMFGVVDGAAVFVAANRGASGIDGLVATAAGVAEGLGQPVTLLIGDLALLHDVNSLALLRERPVVVVVLNNDGGGIFHFLPIAEHADVFEPYFGTPHGMTFESAAAMFGLTYHRAMNPQGFLDAYQAASGQAHGSIIEVKTDRKENHALHQALLAHIDQLLK